MSDRVNVVFGASISGLTAGIEEVKAQIQSIRAPIDMLAGAFTELAEVAGAAFVVERIADFAKEISEASLSTLNLAHAIGLSADDMDTFQEAMTAMGGSADMAGRVLERLEHNMSLALVVPTSQAARALTAMGITTDQVRAKQGDLAGFLDLLREKFSGYADGPAKAALGYDLMGRSFDRLLPILNMSGDQFAAFKTQLDQTGAKLSGPMLEASARLGIQMNVLGLAVEGVGKAIYSSLIDEIRTVVVYMTSWVEEIRQGILAADGLENASSVLGFAVAVLTRTFGDLAAMVGIVVRAMEILASAEAAVADEAESLFAGFAESVTAILTGHWAALPGIWSGVLAKVTAENASAVGAIKADWDALAADLKYIAVGPPLPGNSRPEGSPFGAGSAQRQAPSEVGVTRGRGGGAKGQASELEAWREELQQRLEAERNFFADSTAEELAFWQQKLKLTQSGSKEQASVEATIYGLQKRMAQQGLRDAEQAESRQESLDRNYLNAFERSMKLLVAQKQITLKQALGFDIEYTEQVEAQEKQRLQAFLSDDRLSAAEKQSYYDKLLALEADYDSKVTEYQTEAANNASRAWTDAAKQFSDSFATAATDVITRTKTIGQAFDQLASSIIKDTLNSAIKSLFEGALGIGGGGILGGLGQSLFGSGLAGLVGNPFTAGAGGLLGGSLAGLFGGGAGSVLESTATDFAGGVAGAGAGGGLFGSLFSGLGALLAFSGGGIVPSAAGGWAVPQLGPGGVLAQLHSNEMVLPAPISQGLQGMIAGGGSPSVSANFSVSAMDSQSVAAFFRNNGPLLVASLNKAMRNGSPLMQPG